MAGSRRKNKAWQTKKKRRSSAKATHRPPQTLEDFNSMSEREQDLYVDAMHILHDMVNKKTSLHRAAREYNRDTRSVLRWAHPSLRKRGRRYVPRAGAKQFRLLAMAAVGGNREVPILDFRQASQIGKHWVAIDRAVGPHEDTSLLRTFNGKYIVDVNGEHVPFLTDLAELKRQVSAGEFSFESIYARTA